MDLIELLLKDANTLTESEIPDRFNKFINDFNAINDNIFSNNKYLSLIELKNQVTKCKDLQFDEEELKYFDKIIKKTDFLIDNCLYMLVFENYQKNSCEIFDMFETYDDYKDREYINKITKKIFDSLRKIVFSKRKIEIYNFLYDLRKKDITDFNTIEKIISYCDNKIIINDFPNKFNSIKVEQYYEIDKTRLCINFYLDSKYVGDYYLFINESSYLTNKLKNI